MKKVLFVFNHPAPYKVRLLNEMASFLDLTVIFERNGNKDRNKTFYSENEYKFKQVAIKGKNLGNENFISNGIKKHIKENHYDLIIMNGYSTFAEMKALNYLIEKHIPYTLYINGGIAKNKENAIKKHLKEKYISHAESYLSPDENSNNFLIHYGAKKETIKNYTYSTIYENEILKEIPNDEETKLFREKHSINEGYLFVSCGQLIERKNYEELIRNWPCDNSYHLAIIGDGILKDKLQKLIDSLGKNNIKLLGYLPRKDTLEFFKYSDAFVFPSKEDIYGHVINEAMSQGLPVISCPNVNASKKLIEENINGFILQKFDVKELKEALDKSLKLDKKESLKTAKENTIEIMVLDHKKILA